ncbi:MAG: enzyme component [Clostridiaceae bacterium]|jgi:PTS system glucose-specific IIC component|nr:enzyme component [Clostridiaceae bacterium]
MKKFFRDIFKSLFSNKRSRSYEQGNSKDSVILEAIREKQIEEQVKHDNFTFQEITVDNPINGDILNISHVPDEAFASKLLGDGFAINPYDNKVYSPMDGVVKVLFPTKHAIAIRNEQGIEILVHIGIDTVSLNGEGFASYVSQGEKVKKHQLLLSFDKEIIKNKAKSLISPVIFVTTEKIQEIIIDYGKKEENKQVALIKIAN